MTSIELVLERLDVLDRIDAKLTEVDGRLRHVEVDVGKLTERSEAAESLEGRVREVEKSQAKAKVERRAHWKLTAAIAAAVGGGGAGITEAIKALL